MILFSLNIAWENIDQRMESSDGNAADNYFNIFLVFKNYLQRSYKFSIFTKTELF